jgi:hypothetical protein
MLTEFDDYPIHQTALPVAHPSSGDPNVYDRYFFNGYDPDGEWYFGVALGIYPNRQVIDGAFSFLHHGAQQSVFASGRLPDERAETSIGPIAVEVVEPLRVSRVRVTAEQLGLAADLTFSARSVAVEEPRQTLLDGPHTVMDATRLTQLGHWDGTIRIDGRAFTLDGRRVRGTKDRSWGIRPVGQPVPGAPAPGLASVGGLFFLWAPLDLGDECRFLSLFERPDGTRWHESAASTPILSRGDPVSGRAAERAVRAAGPVRYELSLRPGTRRAAGAVIEYDLGAATAHGGPHPVDRVTLTPLLDFQMKGLGYLHPEWSHGNWHGESQLGTDSWDASDLDPLAFENIHVQQLCRLRSDGPGGSRDGTGVLEQLIIGPHEPSGLRGLIDGYDPASTGDPS